MKDCDALFTQSEVQHRHLQWLRSSTEARSNWAVSAVFFLSSFEADSLENGTI